MYIPLDQIWIVVVGFVIAFILAFGIGANDVANSFGTSVGSKVLSLRSACILASIFEVMGSVLLGGKVSDTIRQGVFLPGAFQSSNITNVAEVVMMGHLSSLSGACIWLLIATFFKLPVSGSHSIVGAMVGYAVVVLGFKQINWLKLGLIVVSWFASPILSGLISVITFVIFDKLILQKEDYLECGLKLLPFFYALAIFINIFSIFLSGPPLLRFDLVPLYGNFIVSIGLSVITILVVRFAIVPYIRRTIKENEIGLKEIQDKNVNENGDNTLEQAQSSNDLKINGFKSKEIPDKNVNENENKNLELDQSSNDLKINGFKLKEIPEKNVNKNEKRNLEQVQSYNDLEIIVIKDSSEQKYVEKSPRDLESNVVKEVAIIDYKPEEAAIFKGLQILTAIFGSFAHGGNDVSNAIGPLVGLWIVAITQDIYSKIAIPIWILFYGGFGIIIGLWVWGRRVMKTIGDDLTKITPSSGVSIELGSAITVLIASNIGIPISTTHCKVGSIVLVGRYRSNENVDWKIFRNIVIAWVVTVPAAAGISALIMFLLRFLV